MCLIGKYAFSTKARVLQRKDPLQVNSYAVNPAGTKMMHNEISVSNGLMCTWRRS